MLPNNHSGRICTVFDDPRHPGPGRLPHSNLPSLHDSHRWIRAKAEGFIGLNKRSRQPVQTDTHIGGRGSLLS